MTEAPSGTPRRRHAQLKAIFDSVLSHRLSRRRARLDAVAVDDPTLAGEVASLLKHHEEAGDLFEPPETDAGPAFSTGELVAGRFRIVRIIGRGGMGEVYEAVDLVLQQPVALKTIRSEVAGDPATRALFFRELNLARRVAHRNVCRTHELWRDESSPQRVFLTMELLEGESLGTVLKREQRLDPARALPLLEQLAEALAAIHRLTIIHRDLKPSNVHIVADGEAGLRVVVTDFGLARTTATVGSATHTAVLAGTPAYMAPEQFETGECSIASDVYAFGVICFEMLTGQRQPVVPARSVRPDLDPRWEAFILRCVSQDPRKRPVNAEALIEELRALSGQPRGGRRRLRYLASALVISGVTAGAWTAWSPVNPTGRSPEFNRLTLDPGLSCELTASRDGRTIAYSSDRGTDGLFQIWMQALPDGERVQLTHGPSHAVNPTISPDGTMVAFRREHNDGGIYVVPASGAPERRLAPYGRHPRFSPDGTQIVFWTGVEGDHTFASGKLWVVTVASGEIRPLHHQLVDARFPAWSPDGRFIVFRGSATPGPTWDQRSDWWVSDAGGRQAVPTGAFARLTALRLSLHDGGISWSPGQLLFPARAGHSTNLWRLPISDKTGAIAGEPERLTSGSNLETSPWPLGSEFVAYTNWEVSGQIWRVWTKGPRTGTAEALTATDALDTRPAVSATGTRLMFTRRLGEIRNLWIKELSGGQESQLVPNVALVPAMSPDGQWVAYSVANGLKRPIFLTSAAGGDRPQLCEDCGDVQVWSAKGNAVLYLKHGTRDEHTLGALDVASRQVRTIVQRQGVTEGSLSPDGQYVTFAVRDEGVRSRIYIAPVATAGDRRTWRALTSATDWADKPRWDPDGRALYFYSEQDGFGCLWRQQLDDGKPAGAAEAVRHLHEAQHAIFHLSRQAFGLSVGPDFVVYNVPSVKGNLWTMDYPQKRTSWTWLRRWFGGSNSTGSQ